jgi:hypothetical protein
MSSIDESKVAIVKEGLAHLADVIEKMSGTVPQPVVFEPLDRSISGNKIHGGKITKFESVGIKDESTRLVVLVNNDGLLTDNIDVDTLVGDTKVSGNLEVAGEITAQKLHVKEITSDTRQERTSPLVFHATEDGSIYNKGLLWTGNGPTKQFILREGPDRLWSSEPIEVHGDTGAYYINDNKVLTQYELGPSIKNSSLTRVGALKDLRTTGNVNLDDYVFWDSGAQRFSIGTETPNGTFSITSLDAEFIIEPEGRSVKVGNYTTDDLEIITDDTPRITIKSTGDVQIGTKGSDSTKLNVFGRIGVGVNNIDQDVSIHTKGPVKFQDKKFEVASESPSNGVYNVGDVVWNDSPRPGGHMGWVCVRAGTPGEWKLWGLISQ